MGIVHEVAPGSALREEARKLETSILSQAPGALAATKWQLRACAAIDVHQQLDQAVPLSAKARGTDEALEGLASFLEKRPAAWNTK